MPLTRAEGKELVAGLQALVAKYVVDKPAPASSTRQATGGARVERHDELPCASDADLDSKYGRPIVKFDPKSWSGPSQVGKPYDECPSNYLGQLAHALHWSSERNRSEGNDRFAKFDALDSARAQGWRRRIERREEAIRDGDFSEVG